MTEKWRQGVWPCSPAYNIMEIAELKHISLLEFREEKGLSNNNSGFYNDKSMFELSQNRNANKQKCNSLCRPTEHSLILFIHSCYKIKAKEIYFLRTATTTDHSLYVMSDMIREFRVWSASVGVNDSNYTVYLFRIVCLGFHSMSGH